MKTRLLLFLLYLSSTAVFAQTKTQEHINAVENGLTKNEFIAASPIQKFNIYDRMKLHHVNGVSIAVINDGKLEWSKGYGLKDVSNIRDSVNKETLFQLGSVGKIITALAALHLVKEGKMDIDEDVNDKLVSWKVPENEFTAIKKVTLRTLLSHSAGFTDDYGFAGYVPNAVLPTTRQILNAERPANNKKKLIPQTTPGTVEKYSGGGYIIIQQLMEDITHLSFKTYIDSVIFKPLNMSNTTYEYYPDINLNKPIARGHDDDGKIDPKRKYNLYPEMAAAGPWTTAEDMAKLMIEIQKEANGSSALILNQPLAKAMLSPQINSMGLGAHLAGADKPLAFWHAGNTEGYVSLIYGLTEKGQGAIILTNSDKGEWLSLEIMRSVANAYNWPVMQNKSIKLLSADDCLKYTGNYQAANKLQMTIGQNEKGLTLKNNKQVLNLVCLADGSFTIATEEDKLRLIFESNGQQVTGFKILQNGGNSNISLVRLP